MNNPRLALGLVGCLLLLGACRSGLSETDRAELQRARQEATDARIAASAAEASARASADAASRSAAAAAAAQEKADRAFQWSQRKPAS